MALTKAQREIKQLIEAVHPAFRLDRQGAHMVFVIEGPLRRVSVVCSNSPSDHRNLRNTRAHAIRACLAAGLQPEIGR